MKYQKITTSFLLCILTLICTAQKSLELTGTPEDSFSYLRWTNDDPNAMFHRYELIKNTASASDTVSIIIERGEVWRQNYLFVHPNYWLDTDPNISYGFSLTAVDQNHLDIMDETVTGVIGPPLGFPTCNWTCESANYAYRVQQYDRLDNKYNYRLEPATNGFNTTLGSPNYYYEWINLDALDISIADFINSSYNQTYYGLYNTDEDVLKYQGILVELPNSGGFQDAQGVQIDPASTWVWGVRKHFGPYVGEDFAFDNRNANKCSDLSGITDIGPLLNWMNTQGWTDSWADEIECLPDPASFEYEGGGNGDDDNGDDWNIDEWLWEMNEWLNDLEENGNGDDGGIILDDSNWEEFVSTFYSFDKGAFNDPLLRYTDIAMESESFRIVKLIRDSSNVIYQGSHLDFVDPQGYPSMPTLNFTPGFYLFSTFSLDHGFRRTFFEVRQNFNSQVYHKDFFEATMYPNPHSGDFYFAEVTTTAKLKGKYEVFDGQGNLHYSYIFNLPKDHSGSHKITPDVTLPNGMLYHKFSFLDGSYETLITIKQ
jgi:hypothetical protein